MEEQLLRLGHATVTGAFAIDERPPRRRRRRPVMVEDAKALLSARFTEHLTLEEVGRAVNVSPFHLARSFRRQTGYTLHEYRTHLRLRAALERLGRGRRGPRGDRARGRLLEPQPPHGELPPRLRRPAVLRAQAGAPSVRVVSAAWGTRSPPPSLPVRTASATARRSSGASTCSRACSSEARFDSDRRSIGLEIELNITEETGDPALANQHVLEMIADPAWQTELAQFNIEINIPPATLEGGLFSDLENAVRASLNHAEEGAQKAHTRLLMVGILPTLSEEQLNGSVLTANPRYELLNEQIFAARGEDLHLAIDGVERLSVYADTIAPEAACTSVQLHQLVDPSKFANHWNAAQCIAGIQLAVGANSPFFFGRELWRETRIALFEQATDTRSEELKAQGVRPRVWFGERWITSIFDLFEENVRFFPSLLPVCEDEDPVEVIERGDTPRLQELRLHNGTIYRWNRPIYDVVRGRPHLRVENRVLPAGPTVVDTLANAALYYGLVRVLADDDRPLWTQMSFSAAEENFHAGARDGIDARVYWPGVGEVPVAELVLRKLLPMAHDGLERWGVDAADRDRLLGIVERRCVERRNGATWMADTFHRLYDRLDRFDALREMTVRYREHMHSNEPVHTWPLD